MIKVALNNVFGFWKDDQQEKYYKVSRLMMRSILLVGIYRYMKILIFIAYLNKWKTKEKSERNEKYHWGLEGRLKDVRK